VADRLQVLDFADLVLVDVELLELGEVREVLDLLDLVGGQLEHAHHRLVDDALDLWLTSSLPS
jgi:hypothetical protein